MNEERRGGFQLYVILGLLVVIVVLFGWKWYAERSLRREFTDREQKFEIQVKSAMSAQASEMLRLASVPLSWAVRASALKQDLDQVDDYFIQYVKEKHIQSLVFVGPDGVVLLATDKKLEGQPYTPLDAPMLDGSSVRVLDDGEHDIVVVTPVMGYDSRLGTLVLTYGRAAVVERTPHPGDPGTGAETAPL